MSETTVNWQATLRQRILIAAGVVGLWVLGIEARLIYLQVFAHDGLVAMADNQQLRQRTLPAERGDIVDRRGRTLATSANAPSIFAVPSKIDDPQQVIARLCAALGNCTRDERVQWLERFNRRDLEFAYARRHVTEEEAARVAALELPAVGIRQETRRFYPNNELAAHVLGFVGRDDQGRENRGLAGLEAAYDKEIRGRDGLAQLIVDSKKRPFSSVQQPPTTGSTIELTIDENLQYIAERELRAAVRHYRAEGGTVVMMNPHTGDILAMASEPTFNPNLPSARPQSAWTNRAVQEYYEPGSTFKLITAAAAIEEGVMTPRTSIDVSGGRIRVGGWRVIEDVHAYGTLSFADVIIKSSNVGAVKIGLQTGAERFGRWVQRFGFGRPISRDFAGENAGMVWDPATWDESALASVSIGYQVGVTALQMATAVSSIANGGSLMEPRIIKAVQRPGGRVEAQPKKLRDTISAETAAILTTIMEGVTMKGGTATAAAVPGYTVAGKTGTAAKLIDGRYSETLRKVSFVGFVPSRQPAVTMVVMIDAPRANGEYGGTVAAPVFQRVAEATLRYLGVGPTVNPEPPVLVDRADQPVIRTVAAPIVPDMPRIVQVTAEMPSDTLPDLRGLSARDATRRLTALGLQFSSYGDGDVVSQVPPAGSPLSGGTVVLTLGRVRSSVGSSTGQP